MLKPKSKSARGTSAREGRSSSRRRPSLRARSGEPAFAGETHEPRPQREPRQAATPTSGSNSTGRYKAVHSPSLVSTSSRKASELSIEALYTSRTGRPTTTPCDELPDECERARLIGDISRVIAEPLMPETTRLAGLTLIGWLARRMPGEAAHAIGVLEARRSERRIRTEVSSGVPSGVPQSRDRVAARKPR